MLKKIMRLALTPLLVLGLTFSGFGMAFASPEVELSDLQIREKLDEINTRYEVGEEFSEEDASFVKEYVSSPSENSAQPMASIHRTFSGSLSNTEGFGFFKGDIGYFGGSFEGYINVQTKDLGKRSSLGVSARITAYGILGSGGIGKIFDQTYSKNENNTNYVALNFGDSLSGVGVSVTAFTYTGFVDGNSFNLYEN
ncbi:hypothetical protein ACPV3A_09070 [Paenibacillus sp. Dod16]|uniref:hypothetical protein n=1 Tax=Paenibacillus sp. Dod16 TaxID=3416392 RepID=UPI003CF1E33C